MSRRRGGTGANGSVRGPSSALTSFLAGLGVEPTGRLTTWGNSADIDGSQQLAPDGPIIGGDVALDPAGAVTARTVEAGPSQVGENTPEVSDDGSTKRKPNEDGGSLPKRRAVSVDSDDLDAEPSSGPSKSATLPNRKSKVDVVPGPLQPVGNFMDCGECSKRFTVTPYTKEHPTEKSTWLCLECCYALGIDPFAKAKKAPKRTAQKKEDRGKVVHYEQRKGVTPLGDLCIQMIGKYIEDVEALGHIGSVNMDKVCKIISKSRRLTPETASLIYSVDRTELAMYDCTRLVSDSYLALAKLCPNLERLHLHLCGQLSTEAVAAWGKGLAHLRSLELFAPFLVRKEGWIDFFEGRGEMLESLSITQSPRIDEETITKLIEYCPNVRTLRLSEIGQLDNTWLVHLAKLNLTSLDLSAPGHTLIDMNVELLLQACTSITSLDLSDNPELSDAILPAIAGLRLHELHLRNLVELTDDGVADFFRSSVSPGLKVIDLEKGHDLRGPALRALLEHSGHSLERLSIMGWREVDSDTLSQLGQCKRLRELNLGWCRQVTDFTMKDILEGCEELQSVRVWGCNQLTDAVPRRKGVKVIGIETHSI
ncbi:hypothetical protein BCR39DRAFT_522058 [Naematelia encephala]|uniref:DNA repair protein rhp7 treble clef domain-containing protein n=1 Tax=Naematelia encephala TaxID=71784 RepID=A0A1Y2BDQ3_9TREE|nr:hypothetical protein BCR39DRAFT_522058 [Naematelia encephala]